VNFVFLNKARENRAHYLRKPSVTAQLSCECVVFNKGQAINQQVPKASARNSCTGCGRYIERSWTFTYSYTRLYRFGRR